MKKLILSLISILFTFQLLFGNTSTKIGEKYNELVDFEKLVDSLELRLLDVRGLEKLNVLTTLCEKLNDANPNKAYNYVGEGLDLARNLNNKVREADLLRYKSNIHQAKGENKKSKQDINEALKINRSLNNSFGVATCLNTIGQNFKVQGDYKEALDKHEKALIIFDSLGTVRDVMDTKRKIGTVYMRQSNFIKALEYYEEVIKISKKEELEPQLTYAYCNKAYVLNNFGKPAEALDIYFKVLNRFRAQNDKYNQTKIRHHIGYVLEKSQLYEEALTYYQEVLEYYENVGNQEYISFILNNYGSVLLAINEYDEALSYFQKSLHRKTAAGIRSIGLPLRNISLVYQKQNNFEKSLDYANQSITAFREVKDYGGLAMAYNDLSSLYLQHHNLSKAEYYSLQALEILVDSKLIRSQKTSYENLATIYKLKSDLPKAVQYQNLLQAVNDSLYSVNKIHSINKQLVQEKLKEKQAEIEILKIAESQKEEEIVALKSDQADNVFRQYLMSGISLMAVLFFGFLFINHQKKQHAHQQSIEAELQAISISKKRLSNQLASIEKETTKNPAEMSNDPSQSIVLPGTAEHIVVPFHQILKIKAKSNYSVFQLEGNREITSSYSLKHFEAFLPDQIFFRVHKSHIINLQKVISYDPGRTGKALLSDGSKIDIAARRKSMFVNVINNLSLVK